MATDQAIALNRFGLGARPGERAGADPRGWLTAQIAAYDPKPAALAGQKGTADLVRLYMDYRIEAEGLRKDRKAAAAASAAPSASMPKKDDPARDDLQAARKAMREAYLGALAARVESAVATPTPFAERLVHFWSNNFAVSADKLSTTALAGDYEFAAIRPHVMGNFRDLLVAATFHPAMMVYLDQARSVGPGSPLAQRAAGRAADGMGRRLGLNENLAREIMELHTLGVRTGYTQADVTELARALTGWTVPGFGHGRYNRPDATGDGQAVFEAGLHEPGARTVMRRSYPAGGEGQARAILADLALHPATARHIATQLARHFVADVPPSTLVTRLEKAFLSSRGDLPTVYRALVAAPEAWAPGPGKFRSPWDWLIAAQRAVGNGRLFVPVATSGMLEQLGQPVWKPPSPAGWGDNASDWAGPGALMARVEASQHIASRIANRTDARELLADVLPDASAATREAVARSESPALGLALMLCSPEFLRR